MTTKKAAVVPLLVRLSVPIVQGSSGQTVGSRSAKETKITEVKRETTDDC